MFVHLRLHTEFSVVDGTTRIDDVVKAAAKDGQGALAITDLSNLFGAVKFYKAARGKGVKPILGAEVYLEVPGTDQAQPPRVLLLVQNHEGYLNLCELLALMHTGEALRNLPVMRWEWLAQRNAGLLMLSGAQAGPVGQALLQGDEEKAQRLATDLATLLPHRFYLEVQRAGRPGEESHVAATAQLAARLHLPLVATHPVQFLERDDYDSHEARVCIADGEILANPKRVRRYTPEQHFKSAAEMAALFADLPAALANSVEIAKRCNLTLTLGKPQLPVFPIPLVDGKQLDEAAYFKHVSHEGLEQRLAFLYPDPVRRDAERPRYVQRLEFEIETILKMGFPGYFLIVGDFINWAKNHDCPVGPGRGSGAGSLVAYALSITDLDPLQYNLLFERFLNPERVSMPDFDIDFCQGNRDRVIDYVKQKYGKDAVSQIATFGTMAARAAIRDAGRVMDLSYTFCDGVSKLIPNKPGMTVTLAYPPRPKPADDKANYALEMEPALAERVEREEDVRNLIEMAQKLEGVARNVGMHAGGVLIAPGKLTDFTPLYQQPGSDSAVSQYDKDDVEAVGLVKFDFLGLATLTILEHAKNMIRARHRGLEQFTFDHIPLDDAATYRIFQDGKTEAVFQFESRGMQATCKEARPTRLEDLIALNALFRPGPMDNIPSFVARKHGREPVEYPHPLVEKMLSETYGIMVYQEQVMQAAQILGGYSLGGADLLRRAMGKKKAEEMAEHRAIFRKGAASNQISEAKADEIFDLMEKFAGYGFNKSHAAAYSLLAYQTAWLKAHHPAEFYAANMTVEMDNTDKLKVLVNDAANFGIAFEAPDVNRGSYMFEPVSDKLVRYGLGAIKGTGRSAIDAIVAAREGRGSGPAGGEVGPFKSLFDFCRRVERTRINKRCVEALIKAGAFDNLQRNRASLVASIDLAFDFAATIEANANQGGLFDMGGADEHGASTQEPALAHAMPWGVKEQLGQEKTAIGFYLSGHLFDEVAPEVRKFVRRRIDDLIDTREPQLLAGIVNDMRVINGQRGKLCLFKLDDKSAAIDARVEEALMNANRSLFQEDGFIVAMGRLQPDRFSGGMQFTVTQVWGLEQARCRFGKFLRVAVNGAIPDVGKILAEFPPQRELSEQGELLRGLPLQFHKTIEVAPENTPVVLHGEPIEVRRIQVPMRLDERHLFYPSDAALASWRAQANGGVAEIVYE